MQLASVLSIKVILCDGVLAYTQVSLCGPLQVTSIQAVLANGTVANFSPQANKHLWRAMQVSSLLM